MRRPWIGGKDFHNFHWTKRTSSRRGDKLGKNEFLGGFLLMKFFLRRGGEGRGVLVDGGKKESGLDVPSISKE